MNRSPKSPHDTSCRRYHNADWIAFVLGDIRPKRRQEMERHADGCSHCRAERESMDRLMAATRDLDERSSASEGLREHVWAKLKDEPVRAKEKPRMMYPSLNLWRPVAAVGIVGSIVFAAVVAPTFMCQPAPVAFAQVEAAMSKLDTVTWRDTYDASLTFYQDGRIIVDPRKRSATRWVRMNPPTEVELFGWGRHVSLRDRTYQIEDNHGGLYYSYYPWGIPGNPAFGPSGNQTPENRLQQAVLFPRNSETKDAGEWQEKYQGKVERDPWTRSETTLDGKKVVRFVTELRYSAPMVSPDDPNGWHRIGETWTFFVEPDSYRIVRRIKVDHYAGYGKTVDGAYVSDQFRYNATPPRGIFDFEPEEGSRYCFVPLPERPSTAEETKAINAVLNRALTARSKGDIAGYLAEWDFDYELTTPERKEHLVREQSRLARNAPILPDFTHFRNLTPAGDFGAYPPPYKTRISGVFTYHAGDAFPPKAPCEFVAAGKIQRKETDGKYHPYFLDVNLRREGDDYKIIRLAEFRMQPSAPLSGMETRPGRRP